MKKHLQYIVVRLSTALAYCAVLLQWFFASVLYISLASVNGWLDELFEQSQQPIIVSQPSAESTTGIGIMDGVLIVLIVGIVLGVTVYALRRLPRSFVRTGDAIVHKSVELVAPLLLRRSHKRPTKKRKLQLTARLIVLMKILLVVMPLLVLIPVALSENAPLDVAIVWTVGIFLFCISSICFTIEAVLVKVFHMPSTEKKD